MYSVETYNSFLSRKCHLQYRKLACKWKIKCNTSVTKGSMLGHHTNGCNSIKSGHPNLKKRGGGITGEKPIGKAVWYQEE
jgi:hypothetical protein